MLEKSSYIEFGLGPGETLSLTRSAGWELLCVSGQAWVTEEGGDDVWLGPGESVRLARTGRTVVEAAGAARSACLKMRRPRPFAALTRWKALLRPASLVLALPARFGAP